MARCEVCFRHCEIPEGGVGFCGGRICENGEVRAGNYGRLTGIALDPIEKKPLQRFHPGSMILSVGSYGCNLRCPFCQNFGISWSEEAKERAAEARFVPPEELVRLALETRSRENIGLAFTYNEPLIGWEYVRDTAKPAHEAGLKNVLVTNGTAELPVLEALLPYTDAMNIDLKGFSEHYYTHTLGGNLEMVKAFITRAVRDTHVELTTLIIPGENDSEEEMRCMTEWISVLSPEIPLHISRFFPRFHMTDRPATDVRKIYHLAEVAREKLKYVYTGNC